MLSIFSCAYWPSVFLLWRNVYLNPFLILNKNLVIFPFIIELKQFTWTLDSHQMYEPQIFFYNSIGCLFTFLIRVL